MADEDAGSRPTTPPEGVVVAGAVAEPGPATGRRKIMVAVACILGGATALALGHQGLAALATAVLIVLWLLREPVETVDPEDFAERAELYGVGERTRPGGRS